MKRWTKVALSVDPLLARKIEKEGKVEVVKRLGDGKIDSIIKVAAEKGEKEKKVSSAIKRAKDKAIISTLVKVAGMKISADAVTSIISGGIETIGNTVVSVVDTVGNTITSVVDTLGNTVSTVSDGYFKMVSSIVSSFSQSGNLSDEIKQVITELDELSTTVQSIQKLSYLSAGLGLANLGLQAAGIAYLGKRLNEIQRSIDIISTQIGSIKSILTSGKISEYHRLSLRFGAITTKLKDNDAINRDDIEALLIDMRAFTSEMIRNFSYEAMDADMILEMVFNLLAAYSALLNVFIRDYYFEKGVFPDNLESYDSLYKELLDENFTRLVRNYLIIKKGLMISEMIRATQAQQVIILNHVLQHEDQIEILKMVETRENYISLMKITDKYAEEEIENLIPVVEAETGIDSCKDIIHDMIGYNETQQV